MAYTISVSGKTYGPATIEQLQELVRRGKITATDYIWDQQTGQWIALGVFRDTSGFFTTSAPTSAEAMATTKPPAGTVSAGDITVTVKTGGGAVRNITPAQLLDAIKKHEILPNDLIWYPRDQRWLFAGSITSLKAIFEEAQAASSHEEEYYVSVKGMRRGPYTKSQMESLVRGGHFDSDDQVWSPQRRAWIPLSESSEFAELLPPLVTQPQYTQTTTVDQTEPSFRPNIHPERLVGLDSSAPIESIDYITKPRQIWGRRILAAAIDAAIILMLLLVNMIVWTLLGYDPLNFRTPNFDFNRALVFYSYAAICILYLIFRDAGGGSVGKRITDILVVKRKNYMRADLGSSFLRNIVLFVPPMILFEIIAVFLNRKGTRIGDFVADTVLMDSSQATFLESEVRKLG